jgi:gamma-glutamyltranspeptidase / glutathione hydrolase
MRNFHLAGRSTVHSLNGMAASSHPLATLTAIEVLKAGGTAADAAVAACALQGVIEPQSTGIGGDCFALIQPKGEGKITSYNGSGRAPKAATAEWYMERKMHAIPTTGPHSVTVPGSIDAWATILRDHGKLGLDVLLQPAIKAAEEGYVVAPRIAFDWKNNLAKVRAGINAPRYLLKNNEAPVAGDVMQQPELGQTLRTIAKLGPDGFYKGYVAEDMVETLRSHGGLHTMEDFASHTTETTVPLNTTYRGLDVWQCPPNGPGITMLVMLNILSNFDLAKYPPMSIERFHLEAEAARIAYLMREQDIGDPAYVDVDTTRILSKQFAADWASKIRMDALVELPDVRPPINPETVYITVIDKDRNVCSFINSVAHSFGSALVSNKTGVVMQNRGAGFRVQPGHPNCIAPGKRPLHTIIPSMTTENGRAKMSFAVMGGQYQPVGQTHVLTNMVDYGMDVQEAIDHPRALHFEGIYQLESGVPAEVADGLAKIGHVIGRPVSPWGGAQAIWIDWAKGTLTGGSEPRKDGCALGY